MPNHSFQHTIVPRPHSNDASLIRILDGLLDRYMERVPDANRVATLITERGDTIINDHIAFRSIDLRSILTIFLHFGYDVRMDDATGQPFNFSSKKLTAVWLSHPNPALPRVFVSQFRFDDGSPALQAIVSRYLAHWQDPIRNLDLNDCDAVVDYLHTGQWPTPTYADYRAIQAESEYVSWVLYNKYYLNHFTLSTHGLASFGFEDDICQSLQAYQHSYQRQMSDTVVEDAIQMMRFKSRRHMQQFNAWLCESGFALNVVGEDNVNVSPDGALLQSSTQANMLSATFPDGVFSIPGSYVEFAYRGLLDAEIRRLVTGTDPIVSLANAKCRDGFETQNADTIFESTYVGVQVDDSSGATCSYEHSCHVIQDFLQKR